MQLRLLARVKESLKLKEVFCEAISILLGIFIPQTSAVAMSSFSLFKCDRASERAC